MPLPKPPVRPAAFLSPRSIEETNKAARRPKPSGVPQASAQVATGDASIASGPAHRLKPETRRDDAAPAPMTRAPASPQTVAAPPTVITMFEPRARRKAQGDAIKMFVLDTNVLMHDPTALFRFEEHDVYLPMMTLEELDDHKKGMSEVARNARQVSRSLDSLVGTAGDDDIDLGIPLAALGNKDAGGRLYFQTHAVPQALPTALPAGKADNQILGVVRALQDAHPSRPVVLVSKDINMRLKARAIGLFAEDYFNDHVLEDTDLLYSGARQLPTDFWDRHGKGIESWQQGGYDLFYKIIGPDCVEIAGQ